jgi:hypothetical protein
MANFIFSILLKQKEIALYLTNKGCMVAVMQRLKDIQTQVTLPVETYKRMLKIK